MATVTKFDQVGRKLFESKQTKGEWATICLHPPKLLDICFSVWRKYETIEPGVRLKKLNCNSTFVSRFSN